MKNAHLVPSRDTFFSPIENMLDKFYTEFFSDPNFPNIEKSGYPKMDIISDDENFTVQALVPGVNEEDLSVEIIPDEAGNRHLKICGKMSKSHEKKDSKYYVKEVSRGSFQRIIRLPNDIKEDPIAELTSGVLTLTWKTNKKKETPEIKKIAVFNKDKPPP